MNKFEELCAELDELDIDYTEYGDNCLVVDREISTRMTVLYDKDNDIFAYYIHNETHETIGVANTTAELLIYLVRYYEGEDR